MAKLTEMVSIALTKNQLTALLQSTQNEGIKLSTGIRNAALKFYKIPLVELDEDDEDDYTTPTVEV